MLEAEPGLNDAPAVLAVTLLSGKGAHLAAPALLPAIIGYELVAGAAIGVAAGLLGALALRRVALPASGLAGRQGKTGRRQCASPPRRVSWMPTSSWLPTGSVPRRGRHCFLTIRGFVTRGSPPGACSPIL
jgi:hypothetical protein